MRLAQAGFTVSVVARGPNLAAIRLAGLRLIDREGREVVARPALASDDSAELGVQDVLVLAVKAHQIAPLLPSLPPLLGRDTVVVPMQNGIPWWYFQRHGGPEEGRVVRAVDPGGLIAATIDSSRIIGCVVYPACEIVAPGIIRHVEGEWFPLGEIDGSRTARVRDLSEAFGRAGLKAPVLDDIRGEIWLKLWGNLVFNPVSALTQATLDRICGNPLGHELAVSMMKEAEAVASSLGIRLRLPLERRIAGAAKVGAHKTSMLQDIESGRQTEVEALVGSVIELARLTGTPVPHIEAVYACTRLLEQTLSGVQVPRGASMAAAA